MVLKAFESRIFLKPEELKQSEQSLFTLKKGTGLKILISTQTLQRLPIALAQTKAGNNSESLLNEMRQFFFLFINQKILLKKYIIT